MNSADPLGDVLNLLRSHEGKIVRLGFAKNKLDGWLLLQRVSNALWLNVYFDTNDGDAIKGRLEMLSGLGFGVSSDSVPIPTGRKTVLLINATLSASMGECAQTILALFSELGVAFPLSPVVVTTENGILLKTRFLFYLPG